MTRARRVGHKGADGIEPGNTPGSFDAALAAGVDMIEFDILSERLEGTGRLLLAHDYEVLRSSPEVTLDEGLAHLASDRFAEVELDVDLKLPGYEIRVLDALREHDLLGRCLISSMYPDSLRVLRAAEPSVRLGWSVPRVRRDYTTGRFTKVPALAAAGAYRAWLPGAATRALRSGACDAIMANWRVVGRRLVDAVHRAGGELYVWTVDDARRIAALEAHGVDGVITNDPRLFSSS